MHICISISLSLYIYIYVCIYIYIYIYISHAKPRSAPRLAPRKRAGPGGRPGPARQAKPVSNSNFLRCFLSRSVDVALLISCRCQARGRFVWKYGGEGTPKAPSWLTTPPTDGALPPPVAIRRILDLCIVQTLYVVAYIL